jgi:hypothetical protein
MEKVKTPTKMHKPVVPSETIGRWIDLDDLDAGEPTREASSRLGHAGTRLSGAPGPGLRFQPFQALASSDLSRSRTSGARSREAARDSML